MALGKREGAIVVLDPQSGRVRAVVNPEIAFGSAFPPGSTMKPFTALAALRAGIIGPDTAMTCGAKYKREDVVDTCSHPPNLPPLTPTEALAYSCNYYFATVAEKLKEEQISSMLSDFGFGRVTGVAAESESAGSLARGQWQPESAVGEGVYLQVTPIQLAMAYGALFNGGKLFTPSVDPGDSTQHLRTQLQIDDKHREILRRGLSGAITFGTAAKAGLDSLPVYILGKTGTSTHLQGFRSQAWFAGVAFPENRKPDTGGAQLVVVVYLKNGHGSEAAEVARPIFAEFAGAGPTNSPTNNLSTYVTVNQVSEHVTQRIPLEDYVLRVVSTEASVENEPEALKALAIAARTYALKNLGRHSKEGYDFCSATHCQRFEANDPRAEVAAAVSETSGLVLRDDREQMIDAYYSASCGGITANLKTIWNTDAPVYRRGGQDHFCHSGPHYRWTDIIASDTLATALRSDPRTDVGETIRDVSVSKHDTTGWAELLTLIGDRRREISGWDSS
jgi:membrane peptidoglycan carboxypeptidase